MVKRLLKASDQHAVIAAWHRSELIRHWSDPAKDIQRELVVQPELFLVAVVDGVVVGTAMGGYDGHRASVYLAVDPIHRGAGIAGALTDELEELLVSLNCPKLNLMDRVTNAAILGSYDHLGYETEDAWSAAGGSSLTPDHVVVPSRRLLPDD